MANLYLHWFDYVFHRSDGPARWAGAKLVRYADDFVVLARYQSQRLTGFIETTLEHPLGLTINRDKTRIVDLNDPKASLDFLGYTFRLYRDLHGRDRRYLNRAPSRKSIERVKERIHEMTGPSQCYKPIALLIQQLNQMLIGWAGYFSQGYRAMAYRAVNFHVRERLMQHLFRRSQRRYRPPKDVTYYEHLKQLDLVYLKAGTRKPVNASR